nr:hypothetical protein [Bifidobacterium catenulatum]
MERIACTCFRQKICTLQKAGLSSTKAAVGDSPIKSTVAVVNGLWMSGFAVVILTGRSDEVMAETCDWLKL